MTRDEFIERAERELHAAEEADARLAAQEGGIQRKRAELQGRISDLRATLQEYREVMGLGEAPAVAMVDRFDGIPNGTIADMAHAILMRKEEPMATRDIVNVLEALGKFESGGGASRRNYTKLYSTLRRDERFCKTAAGSFGVADAVG